MVTIERRLGGLLRYRKVWFPRCEAVLEISQSLQPNEVVRFFGASTVLERLPNLVKHRQLRTACVDLSAGPEEIMKGMKRKSCRYEIRRAEKLSGQFDIVINSSVAQRDFLNVYNDFARTKSLPRFPAVWLSEYSTHGETNVLYLNGRPLCCHFLLRDPQTGIVRLLYSGSRRLETREDADACGALNRYLHWHEMQRYHRQGFATFDFGGIRHPHDPVSRFKLSFGGAVAVEHYYLFSGTQWIGKLGNLMYEKLLRRRTGAQENLGLWENAE
jgi:Acetyltransferase (GNAT) domain